MSCSLNGGVGGERALPSMAPSLMAEKDRFAPTAADAMVLQPRASHAHSQVLQSLGRTAAIASGGQNPRYYSYAQRADAWMRQVERTICAGGRRHTCDLENLSPARERVYSALRLREWHVEGAPWLSLRSRCRLVVLDQRRPVAFG